MATSLVGIPRETAKTAGGIISVYITELSNVTGASVADGIGSFASDAGVWKQFVLGKESGSNFISTQTGNVANGTQQYEQVLTSIFKRNQVSKRNELKVLGKYELVAVINDNDIPATGGTVGNLYIIGLEVENCVGGCDVTTGVMGTGAQFADANGMTLTIRALETMPPLGISEADYALIVAGSAVTA